MAIGIYIQKDTSIPQLFDNCFLQLDGDDGYYWFLYSFFESLAKQTGQMIDLSDDAFFHGVNLDLLNQTIQQARNQISHKLDVWEEFIGTILHKENRTRVEKLYSTVHKKKFEFILAKLENAIAEAKAKGMGIFFFGD